MFQALGMLVNLDLDMERGKFSSNQNHSSLQLLSLMGWRGKHSYGINTEVDCI